MDQLQEPKFQPDSNWRRLLHGTDTLRKQMDEQANNTFYILSFLSCGRYLREVTYYKKNYLLSMLICAGFVASSYCISRKLKEDPFVVAAEENNKKELAYKDEYKRLFLEAEKKNLQLPENLIE
jgi:hypothetical protein